MDPRAKGNKKMREEDVRGELMGMMTRGEKPRDMEERLGQVGRESDAEYIRETKGQDTGASKKKKGMKKGGAVMMSCGGSAHSKKMKSGGKVSRGDGCCKKGKTKGRMC